MIYSVCNQYKDCRRKCNKRRFIPVFTGPSENGPFKCEYYYNTCWIYVTMFQINMFKAVYPKECKYL